MYHFSMKHMVRVALLVGFISICIIIYIAKILLHGDPNQVKTFRPTRLFDSPIINFSLISSFEDEGPNINGPSVIQVPSWVKNPLGKYYLYFAAHNGTHIRMAYTNDLTQNNWTYYGKTLTLKQVQVALSLEEKVCHHIASPDVIVDNEKMLITMYYHVNLCRGSQPSFMAFSKDGVAFEPHDQRVADGFYLRTFKHHGSQYATLKPSFLLRSYDEGKSFQVVKDQFLDENVRHLCLHFEGNILYIFFTEVGDTPERILYTHIDLGSSVLEDWKNEEPYKELLRPTQAWEGAEMAQSPSEEGPIHTLVNQIRDPFVFKDEGSDKLYLFYAGGGEMGIGIALLEAV